MDAEIERLHLATRRQFFEGAGLRAGGIALGMMLGDAPAAPRPRTRRTARSSAAARPAALSAQGESR